MRIFLGISVLPQFFILGLGVDGTSLGNSGFTTRAIARDSMRDTIWQRWKLIDFMIFNIYTELSKDDIICNLCKLHRPLNLLEISFSVCNVKSANSTAPQSITNWGTVKIRCLLSCNCFCPRLHHFGVMSLIAPKRTKGKKSVIVTKPEFCPNLMKLSLKFWNHLCGLGRDVRSSLESTLICRFRYDYLCWSAWADRRVTNQMKSEWKH